ALLNAPDATTNKGLRDRAILAVLLGCGLRRSEVAALTFKHIQQRDGRWCIVDLVGKHGRVGTVPKPTWVKVAVDAWATAAGITDGPVFPLRQSRRPNPGYCVEREGRLAAHPALCGERGRCRHRTPRLSPHVRKAVPNCGR